MTDDLTPHAPLRVIVAGGGVAALETVLALRDLAGDRVATSVLAPAPDYVDRPMTVREPFAFAPARRYTLATLVADMDADLVVDRLAWVDPGTRIVHTTGGQALSYDILVLAMGARLYKRFPHAQTIDDRILDDLFHGLVQDIEGGYVQSVAFVVPERMAWPLPIYELALMMAERAYDTSAQLKITIVTPEDAPLAVFGAGVSQVMQDLLAEAGISLVPRAQADVPSARQVVLKPQNTTIEVDRVVALPELGGPAVRGLPGAAHGFIPVDPYGRVKGVEHVYAAGDATDYPVKHGGIAAQQADTVARTIAAGAGADVKPEPLRAEIHGLLLTGRRPRYFSARAAGAQGFESRVTDTPTWSPPTKVAARYLSEFLQRQDAADVGHST
ncbi:MAG: hypothetical protein JWO02_3855 [Solirubrobacterales bacterium]|nr:hypothetical protein [Solirubrobacterales bacterium]